MDSIGGMNVNYYRIEDIRKALMSNPGLLNRKKFIELFVGYLVARMLEKEAGLNFTVGFPLKAVTKHPHPISGPSLQELIDHPELIDDSDIDIYIGNKDERRPCQVARVVSHGDKNRLARDFFDVLKKKLKVQSDDDPTLIINVEDEISIDKDQLNGFLSKNKIPYGAIFVVGKSGNSAGKFKCWRIYPDLRESEEFDIGIPL